MIKWDTGEVTWEPVSEIRKTDPVTIAKYAREKGLSETPGWKWTRKFTKNPKKFIRISKQMKLSILKGPRFRFGIQVPRNIKEAMELDKINGNTAWQDALEKEIGQLFDYNTFKVLKKG